MAGSPRIRWGSHDYIFENHSTQVGSAVQPIAAPIQDLNQRGIREDHLVLFTSKFNRMP